VRRYGGIVENDPPRLDRGWGAHAINGNDAIANALIDPVLGDVDRIIGGADGRGCCGDGLGLTRYTRESGKTEEDQMFYHIGSFRLVIVPGVYPSGNTCRDFNDSHRYSDYWLIYYPVVQRAYCQPLVAVAEAVVGDVILAWAEPALADVLVVRAGAVVADVLVAALGPVLAGAQLWVGAGAVVAEGLVAGPGAAGERSPPVGG